MPHPFKGGGQPTRIAVDEIVNFPLDSPRGHAPALVRCVSGGVSRARPQSAMEMGGPSRPDRLTPATATGRVKNHMILAKRNKKMKRFVTALAISAFLIAGPRAYADDYTCQVAAGNWAVAATWAGGGFPGAAPAVGSRAYDRAVLARAGGCAVAFPAGSGAWVFASLMIQEMQIDAATPNAAQSVTVTGDRLQLRYTEMLSGAAGAATATLTVTNGIFKTDDLVLDSSEANQTVTIGLGGTQTTLRVAGETLVKGTGVKCEPAAGTTIDFGLLTMEPGSILANTGAATGVCQAR